MNGKMESAQRIVPHFQVIVSGVKINSVLERIGDFAVSIAEEVIFIASGRDVRYHA
jgi:phosphate uptake regulator